MKRRAFPVWTSALRQRYHGAPREDAEGFSLLDAAAIPLLIAFLAAFCMATPIDEARVAGLASLTCTLVLCLAVLSARVLRRVLLAEMTVGGTIVGAILLPSATDTKGVIATLASALSLVERPLWLGVNGNTLGVLLAVAPVAAVALGLTTQSKARAALWFCTAGVGFAEVGLTGSRAAVMAVTIGVITALAATRRISVQHGAVAIAAGLVLASVVATGDRSLETRFEIWRQGSALIVSPLGIGYGAFAALQAASPVIVISGESPLSLHSSYLQTLSDFGLAGGLGLALVAILGARRAIHSLTRSCSETHLTFSPVDVSAVLFLSGGACLLAEGLLEVCFTMPIAFGSTAITVVSPIPLLVLALPFAPVVGHGVPVSPR